MGDQVCQDWQDRQVQEAHQVNQVEPVILVRPVKAASTPSAEKEIEVILDGLARRADQAFLVHLDLKVVKEILDLTVLLVFLVHRGRKGEWA